MIFTVLKTLFFVFRAVMCAKRRTGNVLFGYSNNVVVESIMCRISIHSKVLIFVFGNKAQIGSSSPVARRLLMANKPDVHTDGKKWTNTMPDNNMIII